ncbi:MAG: exodeoxyribonuclease VII small subunit [Chloroflexota bacterium]|nr:exodeoxyribonuclease VII small subunit [Chloroflexota bacterium]MDQ3512591.1 exodeoxyribonuclease VII small subunit [Chloroflexota bacterium]
MGTIDDASEDLARWQDALRTGTFEDRVAALEAVVERLELGNTSMDAAIDLYELGMGLASAATATIDAAELRVEELSRQAAKVARQSRIIQFPFTDDDADDGDGDHGPDEAPF